MAQEQSSQRLETRITPVRKSFQIGRWVLGGRLDPEDGVPVTPFTRFTAQRPVVYSGTSAGFFEDKRALGFLGSLRSVAQLTMVPHTSVVNPDLVKRVLASRPNANIFEVISECRELVDDLPDKRYGHVRGAHSSGCYVTLELDHTSKKGVKKDFTGIQAHFGIDDDRLEASFSPHLNIARAIDPETAHAVAQELDEFIRPAENSIGMPVAFGGVTVLAGSNNNG